MKKSGLLTWFTYNNYGTVLQLYALNKKIQEAGFHNEIINYIPKQTYHEPLVTRIIKHPLFSISEIIYQKKNKYYKSNEKQIQTIIEKFDLFRAKEFIFSRECKTASELFQLNEYYDVFVCGSDQIWSPFCFDKRFYLDFVTESDKIIAYAPSIGTEKIKNKYIENAVSKLINRFKYISIREDSGKAIIYDLVNKNAEQVLDPTLLLDASEWDDLIDFDSSSKDSGYILCYFLGVNEKHWKLIRKIQSYTKIPVKIIPVHSKDYIRPFEVIMGIGPIDFLQLVKNASFIYTDSFHGTIFSIIYKKPFYTFNRFPKNHPKNQNTRIYSLLRLLCLEDRLIINNKNILSLLDDKEINFDAAHSILDNERKRSIAFLSKSLSEAYRVVSGEEKMVITNTCCGCGICVSICTKKAIKIDMNEKGFYEALIDHDICIKCKRCRDVCPFGKCTPSKKIKTVTLLFAVYSNNRDVLKTSSSGGIGWELANYFNDRHQDVFGCIYFPEKRRAETVQIKPHEKEKLKLLSGSKYIQSNMAEIYVKIQQSEGGIFFGTPCQIAAIDLYLRRNSQRKKMVLVDLICHGIPTDFLWKKYLYDGNVKYHYGDAPNVQFRLKERGWEDRWIRIHGNETTYIRREKKDPFYRFFLAGNCYSESCYECRFRDSSSADIRIGDYWGPRFKGNKNGVSMVIPLTQEGKQILEILQKQGSITLFQTDISDYFHFQQTSNYSQPFEYENIILDLKNSSMNIEKLANIYCSDAELSNNISKTIGPMIRIAKKACRILPR